MDTMPPNIRTVLSSKDVDAYLGGDVMALFRNQLLIVLLNRLGGTVEIPVSEVDATLVAQTMAHVAHLVGYTSAARQDWVVNALAYLQLAIIGGVSVHGRRADRHSRRLWSWLHDRLGLARVEGDKL